MPLMTYYVRGHRPAPGNVIFSTTQSVQMEIHHMTSHRFSLWKIATTPSQQIFRDGDNSFTSLAQEHDFVAGFFLFFSFLSFTFVLFFVFHLKIWANMIAVMLVDDVIWRQLWCLRCYPNPRYSKRHFSGSCVPFSHTNYCGKQRGLWNLQLPWNHSESNSSAGFQKSKACDSG